MKNILIAIAAITVMGFASCAVRAGLQVGSTDSKAPKDQVKSSAGSKTNQKDSVQLQSPVNPEPVK
ncbi:MAG: hypothetical protein JJE25_12390 [Bacteroidia bacterium]|nr:hypothetical protein [Bacteroidia bacterium]